MALGAAFFVALAVRADVYVAPTGDDGNDGSSWAAAKLTIQAGVDAAPSGGVVRVAAGTYNTGGQRVGHGAEHRVTNRVVITRGVSVIAEDGPDVTFIVGEKDWTNPDYEGDGEAAIRGVWMAEGTRLAGFTVTNGATRGQGDDTDGSGGGIWCVDHTAIISNCVLAGNSTFYGGAVRRGTLYNCVVSNNTGHSIGGGLFESVAHDTLITHNRTIFRGGGAHTSVLHNCVVSFNVAAADDSNTGQGGGASYSWLYSCMVTGNTARLAGGGIAFSTAEDCTITGNAASTHPPTGSGGGGAYVSTLLNCVVQGNVSGEDAGGVLGGTAEACRIIGNSAKNGGGARGGTFENCLIASNTAVQSGGGTYSITAYSSLIAGNTAGDQGGGARGGLLINCTVADNTAGSEGGGVYMAYATNSILWGNSAPSGANHAMAGGRVNYSCTTPLPGFGSVGNIADDPLFANAAGGDFRLQSGSPCVNAGINQAWMDGARDLDGKPRIIGATVDLGAYEFGDPPEMPPQITRQPASQTVNAGTNALFSVTASGTPTLHYAWLKDGVSMPEMTAPNLVLVDVRVTANGDYWCIVSNAYGTVTSQVATFTVRPVALPQTIRMPEGTVSTNITLTSIYGGAVDYDLATAPQHGGLTTNGALPNLTFTPPPGYAGRDAFTFTVTGGGIESEPATITLLIGKQAGGVTPMFLLLE